MTEALAVKPKESPILNPSRINLAEYVRQDWVVNAEEGTTVEQAQDPAYFAHVAAKFKPYDHIEVRAEDGAWIAEFLVVDCSRTWAKVFTLSYHKLAEKVEASKPEAKYKVAWKGPQRLHAVIRVADNAIISEGHSSAEIAQLALKQHEQVTG